MTPPVSGDPGFASTGAGLPVVRWFDAWAGTQDRAFDDSRKLEWVRVVPFLVLHLACLLVLVAGWSWFAVAVAAAFYAVRMFAITAFYHRYFSHRAFRTSRGMQFGFALLGATAVQRGPLWWAAHHRVHHKHSDRERDVHSPVRDGFFWSHIGWILSRGSFRTRLEHVRDLARYPELRFLDRFDILVPLATLAGFWGLGAWLESASPGLGTNALQLTVWGFCVSTVVLYHCTFLVNSIAHRRGSRRYATKDESRNSFLLSLITFGEGWHNNHHRFPASARQGFFWWELDLSYYLLRMMQAVGLVWDLKPVPTRILDEGRER